MRKPLLLVLVALLLSTTAHAGNNTSDLPAVPTIAALRLNSFPTPTLYVQGFRSLNDGGQGPVNYDASDSTTADNSCTVYVDAAGHRYKRDTQGQGVNFFWCGAYGDNSHDDTTALQAALTVASAATNPGVYGVNSPAAGSSSAFCGTGYFKVSGTLTLTGFISLVGQGNTTDGAGCRIKQVTAGIPLLQVAAGSDGNSASIYLHGIDLIAGASSETPGTALFYVPATVASVNSIYIDHVWFQTPEDLAVRIDGGDDIQITDNTFDVSAFHAISLGSAGKQVSNVRIVGNDFFDIRAGVVELNNAIDWTFAHNTVFGAVGGTQIPFVIDALTTNPVNAKNGTITGNVVSRANSLIQANSAAQNLAITGNAAVLATAPLILVGGGSAALASLTVTGNALDGAAGTGVGIIDIPATFGIVNSTISGNAITCNDGGSSDFGIHSPATAADHNHIWANAYGGCTTNLSVHSQPMNGVDDGTASGTLAPGTISAGAQFTSSLTVPGALPNQECQTVLPQTGLPAGIVTFCFVSNTNTITLVEQNVTAGGIAVSSHQLIARVRSASSY